MTEIETADAHRDVMMQAARAYEATQHHIEELENQLHAAVAGLEAKNSEIGELKLFLAEERNNVASYRAERDEAVAQRSDALAMLANIRGWAEHLSAMLNQPEIPLPPAKRRRNGGKHDGDGVVDHVGVPGTSAGSAMPTSTER